MQLYPLEFGVDYPKEEHGAVVEVTYNSDSSQLEQRFSRRQIIPSMVGQNKVIDACVDTTGCMDSDSRKLRTND